MCDHPNEFKVEEEKMKILTLERLYTTQMSNIFIW